MEIRILETREIKTLEIIDENGIEWTRDLLAGRKELLYNSKAEEYEMSKDDYDWWDKYIKNHESDTEEIKELAKELQINENEIWNIIHEERHFDLEDEHKIIQMILEEFRTRC